MLAFAFLFPTTVIQLYLFVVYFIPLIRITNADEYNIELYYRLLEASVVFALSVGAIYASADMFARKLFVSVQVATILIFAVSPEHAFYLYCGMLVELAASYAIDKMSGKMCCLFGVLWFASEFMMRLQFAFALKVAILWVFQKNVIE